MTSEPTTTTATTAVNPGRHDLGAVADRLVEKARTDEVPLTGPGGLLGGLTKKVLETALAAERRRGQRGGVPWGPSKRTWTRPVAVPGAARRR